MHTDTDIRNYGEFLGCKFADQNAITKEVFCTCFKEFCKHVSCNMKPKRT
jgi:hypothetical protein